MSLTFFRNKFCGVASISMSSLPFEIMKEAFSVMELSTRCWYAVRCGFVWSGTPSPMTTARLFLVLWPPP